MSLFSGKRRRMVSGRPDIPSAPERPVPVWSAPCCPGRGWRHRRGYGNLSGACHSQGKSDPFSPDIAAGYAKNKNARVTRATLKML